MKLRLSIGMILSLLLVGAMAFSATAAVIPGGSLDTTWGTTGIVTTASAPSTNSDGSEAQAIQKDGKVVEGGWSYNGTDYDFLVARYNKDGTLDTTWGGTGKVITNVSSTYDDYIMDLAIQKDGKVVAVGVADNLAGGDNFASARYNTDGTLDTTWGGTGTIITAVAPGTNHDDAYDVRVLSDGSVILGGEADMAGTTGYDMAFVQYTSTGVLNTAFDADGIKTIAVGPGTNTDYVGGMGVQSDGMIVAGGQCDMAGSDDMCFVRMSSAGALDTTFSGDGIQTVDFPGAINDGMWSHGIGIDANGNIVGGGWSGSDIGVARLTSAGVLDTTFSTDGMVTTTVTGDDYCNTVQIQTDGRIVCAGTTSEASDRIVLARYNSDGSLDTSFGPLSALPGTVLTSIGLGDAGSEGMNIQKDGNIVAGGWSDTVAGGQDLTSARYNYGSYLYRSDAIIAKVGNDIYWGGQKTSAKVASGKAKSLKIKLQNDGTSSDTLWVHGANSKGKSKTAFSVTYWKGSKNITKKVTKGTYSTGTLAPQASVTIKMRIAAIGSSGHKTFWVTATSGGYSGSVDKVKANAKVA